MYKHLYSEFLKNSQYPLHLAAHSHHYWPDISFEAHKKYWSDSSKFVDSKWEELFGEHHNQLKMLTAENLGIEGQNPSIIFTSNTHELAFRLMSCHFDSWLKSGKAPRILTTDSEFYSFSRQLDRLEELGAHVHRVKVEPFESFPSRWSDAAKLGNWDLSFVSQVFFNSGLAIDLDSTLEAVENHSKMMVVDAYHSYMALPFSWKKWQQKAYLLGGGYKYAQGGEGACFLVMPPNQERPVYTGWFAEMGTLSDKKSGVAYPNSEWRFAGSTIDGSALYRQRAVLQLFKDHKLSVSAIHSYIQNLQKEFLSELESLNHPLIKKENLVCQNLNWHGHFLAFDLGSPEKVTEIRKSLHAKGLYCDGRGSRIRFGFGLYHEAPFHLEKYFL